MVEVVRNRKKQITKNKVRDDCVGCKETSDDSKEEKPPLPMETPVTKRIKLNPSKMRGLEETGDRRLWSPKKFKEVGSDDAKRSSGIVGKIRSRSTERLVPGNNNCRMPCTRCLSIRGRQPCPMLKLCAAPSSQLDARLYNASSSSP